MLCCTGSACSETNVVQRYFLAEILKKSSIAPLDLMNFIQERGIQPSWYDIALPNGTPGKVPEELARAENNTYRSLRLLMHCSLATPASESPPVSVHGPGPTYGQFRTAVCAARFEAKEKASSFRRKRTFSRGPSDSATVAIQLSFREFSERSCHRSRCYALWFGKAAEEEARTSEQVRTRSQGSRSCSTRRNISTHPEEEEDPATIAAWSAKPGHGHPQHARGWHCGRRFSWHEKCSNASSRTRRSKWASF